MSWNYRIVKTKIADGEFEFGIHEVFYDDSGNIEGMTEKSVVPACPSVEGLKYELEERIMKSFEEDTLLVKKNNS